MVVAVAPAHAATDVLEILPVRDTQLRLVLVRPATPPTAAVVLMAGGSGRLDIDGNGRIRAFTRNQLVRTRAAYAAAGFLAVVPDVPEDVKEGAAGVTTNYRMAAYHAADIGDLVVHLRRRVQKVFLVGTSRGALSVANAAVRLEGARKPDAIVLTSAMLMHVTEAQPSIQRYMQPLRAITMPVLLVAHEADACVYTPATAVARFRPLLTGAPRVDVAMLTGGQADPPGQECEADGHHGFMGLDGVVVQTVAGWLNALH